MDKKSKILFGIFFLAVFISAGMSFYKYYILKDYYILAEKDCDPQKERCFVRECDPVSDAGCPEEKTLLIYYKLIEKNASTMQDCDPKDSSCTALDCKEGEGCTEILCDEEAEEEGDVCNDPETYLKELEQESQAEDIL
jgi:hypothetical protein